MARNLPERYSMMTILILLSVLVPILGFLIARMEDNITTNKIPSVKEGLYGAGGALGILGSFSFVAWLIVWVWSISLSTLPTWIDMSLWLVYSVITIALGGLMMAVTKPRN